MALTALQRAKAANRRKAKGLKPKARPPVSRDCIIHQNVIIPDIEFGAFSFIGQPPSPESGIPDFLC